MYVTTIRDFANRNESEIIVTSGKGLITDIALMNLRHIWRPLYMIEVPVNIIKILWLAFSGRIFASGAIFHVHGVANIAPIFAARVMRIPVLWHLHETGINFRWIFAIGKLALKRGRFYIAVVAQKCAAAYALRDFVFLPGVIDHRFWRPATSGLAYTSEFDAALEWADSNGDASIRLLTVGNLNPTKGLDVLLDALRGCRRPVTLKIVGAELLTHQEFANTIYEYAKRLNADSINLRFEFLQWQNKNAVRSLMAGCHAFVLPSRSEACPLVLLEALAMGCLCVASDVGDVRLMLGGDARHRVFQPGAVEELREILQTLESPPPPPRLNSMFVDEWKLERVAAKISAIYDELRKPSAK